MLLKAGHVFQVGLDLSGVPFADLPLLPLFSRLLLETGTAAEDRVSLDRRIGATTGGVSASHSIVPKAGGGGGAAAAAPDAVVPLYLLQGKAVAARAAELFEIIAAVLTSAQLGSRQRAVEMVRESKAAAVGSAAAMGHAFASMRISASQSLAGYCAEQTGGLSYLASLDALLEATESEAAGGWPR